jgi:ribulose-phosphate 3-epimerase
MAKPRRSLATLALLLHLARSTPSPRRVVVGVDGGTESIRACCFDALSGHVIGKSCAIPYPTYHPRPGWAEQDPADWYENLGQAVRGAVESIPTDETCEFSAICLDTTCCSVVALDSEFTPLRRSLLWMDARASSQTEAIMEKCRGDPALKVNCGGEGPLSAEWMTPKALWIKQSEPEIWEAATTICEYQDYLNYKLTNVMCASSCNAAARWHWDGEDCIKDATSGRPLSLYETLGIPELANKLPQKCLAMGAVVGTLTAEASQHLNLPEGLPVAQGGPDAFVGMIGLGCVQVGQLCLITGSSHLLCVVSSKPTNAAGTWGAYRGAPLPGFNFAEGGQSSTGSIIRWAKKIFGDNVEYNELDDEASNIPPGCEGLVALETFQGSRTPVTDSLARGALMGLTLSHTRSHIWRALMEGVCFGTRACVEGLANAGHDCGEIVIAGGATRSPLWLQMHADITGKPVIVCENADAPLLGSAILASVGAGVHRSVDDAVKAMVRTSKRVEPDPQSAAIYNELYEKVYTKVSLSARPVSHAIAALRGGSIANKKSSHPIISPSLLACDWSSMKSEIGRCLKAGVPHLHIDVFDGVFLDSPLAFTFGPQMIKAIRQSCDELTLEHGLVAVLDLHVCVDRPHRFVQPMADAGATRFIFQWEAMPGANDDQRFASAALLAQDVVRSGMKCGVSINPETQFQEILPLLETGLVDVVDCLSVKPGFGGQDFQPNTLEKIRGLAEWRQGTSIEFLIMCDGGVNADTAHAINQAGADILVAGTFLFHHDKGLGFGLDELRSQATKPRSSS